MKLTSRDAAVLVGDYSRCWKGSTDSLSSRRQMFVCTGRAAFNECLQSCAERCWPRPAVGLLRATSPLTWRLNHGLWQPPILPIDDNDIFLIKAVVISDFYYIIIWIKKTELHFGKGLNMFYVVEVILFHPQFLGIQDFFPTKFVG